MYEDSWYSYVPESHKNDDSSSKNVRHRRKESLLKQPNGGAQIPYPSNQIMGLYEETPGLQGPPEATLVRRAKSYSDFYEVAMSYLPKDSKIGKKKDVFNEKSGKSTVEDPFEELENDLLDESHKEFQLYRDQLHLSENHLDSLLKDTDDALDLLASLSTAFQTVESETTAFQGQCEDLLEEQKRLRDLAHEVGTDLQYYAYLEPLTKRLNAPGAGRLARGDDFLDMLRNLNTCIEFMDQHPNYRDSNVFKTRYLSLLERSLNLVQVSFSTAFTEVSNEVSKELRSKEHNETSEYVHLYGKFETLPNILGSPVEQLLKTTEFAFGQQDDSAQSAAYAIRYHELFSQIVAAYLKSREIVSTVILKNLKRFATTDKPSSDFQSFARHCIQYILDICYNEQNLVAKFFQDGPLLLEYPNLTGWNKASDYAERLDNSILVHLGTLQTFLATYLNTGDLQRICDIVNWLETTYMASADGEVDMDASQDSRAWIAHTLLSKYLWKALNEQFSKAASEIEHFKPSQDDLKVVAKVQVLTNKTNKGTESDTIVESQNGPLVSNAYPTVRTAVRLLIMYNDGFSDRPRTGDVLYEIVHQATESLQKAATVIKKTSGMMDAQLFLIKNLMLIENLFMTHEIPDSIRQSAEFDFTPIWDTIGELQAQKQLFNPLAYITPLVKGKLLPAVIDRLLDARKELERVLVQQITAFTRTWQGRLAEKDFSKREAALGELEVLLRRVFDDETTRGALWRMIRAEE